MPESPLPVNNEHLKSWIDEMARHARPDRIYWCDGSEDERQRLTTEAVQQGILHPLNPEKLPNCHLHRSDPNDVARVEHLTFICTPTREEAGPTNNWMAPDEAYRKVGRLFEGAMQGRTMYVVPYVMGPVGSPMARIGVELTDSIYVALSMGLMTRVGTVALAALGDSDYFNRGLHSLGDLDPGRRFICHFPQDNTIWSIGSGYGGNVLLGKKCLALRIGSWLGRREGWMAEHMLLIEVESPEGEKHYVAGAFPSACGKTNFAMMVPPAELRGWRIRTIGEDIAWMRPGNDGRLRAINPEAGYFGVVPGTNFRTNPNAMRMISHDALFTNVALAPDGTVWWEGKDGERPEGLIDWKGKPFDPTRPEPAAHPNSRFTVPMANNPVLSSLANDPEGVPISAILFGGRRSDTVPLVMESLGWEHGVYLGATLASETTAAATGKMGVLRRDPMAMLPFCGYDMGEYFGHWLEMGRRLSNPPPIYLVNWFRKDDGGRFLWPGYSENLRVLQWILARLDGTAPAHLTPAGRVPYAEDLNLAGLELERARVVEALEVRREEWQREHELQAELFKLLERTMPQELVDQRARLQERLDQALSPGPMTEAVPTEWTEASE